MEIINKNELEWEFVTIHLDLDLLWLRIMNGIKIKKK